MYKHFFLCAACTKHVVSFTDDFTPWQPGRTHWEALENGGCYAAPRDPGPEGCIGVLSYCSGVLTKPPYSPCGLQHRGSENFHPQPEPKADPNWDDFANRVTNAWNAFVNSGYSPALRGANNYGEYRLPGSVSSRLRNSGGVVLIGGATYIVSDSRHANVSLHRAIPGAYQQGNIRSFVFHL